MTYLIPEDEREELISPDGQRTETPDTPEEHVRLRNTGWRTRAEHDLAAASDADTAARVHAPSSGPHSAHDSTQPDSERNPAGRRPRGGQAPAGETGGASA